ncbi:unnamed protein product, partial [Anisakis simplex]|uniref:malate synthase n=1 Tax=Anisakis simplex TaxID=6269 RepID=A0A0M3JE67_ANISI
MTAPFLRAYALASIKACHARKISAMGGMAAQIPIKNDQIANRKALAFVKQDKEREATDGHDGTWVAHPDLVKVARDVFDTTMPQQNQIDKLLNSVSVTSEDLTAIPEGTRTERSFRHNIAVTLGEFALSIQMNGLFSGYMDSWLSGVGCVPLYNLMEDAAT